MDKFLETFSITVVLVILALLMIGLSWVLTGKQKVKGGTCGRDPTKDKDKSCGTKASCTLCENGNKEEKKTPESKDTENE